MSFAADRIRLSLTTSITPNLRKCSGFMFGVIADIITKDGESSRLGDFPTGWLKSGGPGSLLSPEREGS